MSAYKIQRETGVEFKIAEKLDKFWLNLASGEKVALATAFNFAWKRNTRIPEFSGPFCLQNALVADAQRASNLECVFLHFLLSRIAKCDTAEEMMQEIIDWHKLPEKEQEATRRLS